jgi:hypothetical protein
MSFSIDAATRPKTPTFKFTKIGDKVTYRITDVQDEVITDNDHGGKDHSIVLTIEVLGAKGGDTTKDDETDEVIVTDTAVGEIRSLWLRYKQSTKDTPVRDSFAPMTRAIAAAVKEAGGKAIEVGAEGTLEFNELGKKPDDPKKNRAKLFAATYKLPVKASAVDLTQF